MSNPTKPCDETNKTTDTNPQSQKPAKPETRKPIDQQSHPTRRTRESKPEKGSRKRKGQQTAHRRTPPQNNPSKLFPEKVSRKVPRDTRKNNDECFEKAHRVRQSKGKQQRVKQTRKTTKVSTSETPPKSPSNGQKEQKQLLSKGLNNSIVQRNRNKRNRRDNRNEKDF